jgi:hypothetical protein
MRRSFLVATALLSLGACRTYETYPKLSDQGGLTPPDAFAQYGGEQAQKVAIGRMFAQSRTGDTPEDRKKQVDATVAYAKKMTDVVSVTPDTLGYWITVSFKSGWRVAVMPIGDGVAPDATAGLKGS